jgi:hypothetical protein
MHRRGAARVAVFADSRAALRSLSFSLIGGGIFVAGLVIWAMLTANCTSPLMTLALPWGLTVGPVTDLIRNAPLHAVATPVHDSGLPTDAPVLRPLTCNPAGLPLMEGRNR